MAKSQTKGRTLPRELEGAATAKDVDVLQEKIGKSYSSERYAEFQDAVKKIALETIGSAEGRTAIKAHAKEATKEYIDDNSWKRVTFWIPTIVSIIATAVAIWALFIHKVS